MLLRVAISLFLLSFAVHGLRAKVSTVNQSVPAAQEASKKPTPTPTPPPDGPDPGNPGGPGRTKTMVVSTADNTAADWGDESIRQNANATVERTFKAGNEALAMAIQASRVGNSDDAIQKYTAAIAQYDEGLVADAQQVALICNKATALNRRGIERYNAAVKSSKLDEAGRSSALQTAKDDFKAGAEAANKAVSILKAQPVPTDPQELSRYNANKYAALFIRAEAMRLFVSKFDPKSAEEAVTALREYLAVETDPGKQTRGHVDLAQMLLESGAPDKALAEFQSILATQPNSPEANLGAGLAFYQTGDTARAAAYLQRFVEIAPDTNAMKDNARQILTEVRNKANVPASTSIRPGRPQP